MFLGLLKTRFRRCRYYNEQIKLNGKQKAFDFYLVENAGKIEEAKLPARLSLRNLHDLIYFWLRVEQSRARLSGSKFDSESLNSSRIVERLKALERKREGCIPIVEGVLSSPFWAERLPLIYKRLGVYFSAI